MMDIDGLYEIVKQTNKFNRINFEKLESVINAQNTRTRAEMESIEHNLQHEILQIKEHQIKSNGKIAKSEQELKPLKWIKKHPWLCIGIFIFITYVTNIILTVFSLKELIQMAF